MMLGRHSRPPRKQRQRKVGRLRVGSVAQEILFPGVVFFFLSVISPPKSAIALQTVGKYTALLAILIVGSFIIPMAQYFWYVRDDDSSDRFFAQNVPEPEEPKKKGWFK
jgi:hypothetical protein